MRDEVEDLAKVLCCIEAGDEDPFPAPDGLMPNNWPVYKDQYMRISNTILDYLRSSYYE